MTSEEKRAGGLSDWEVWLSENVRDYFDRRPYRGGPLSGQALEEAVRALWEEVRGGISPAKERRAAGGEVQAEIADIHRRAHRALRALDKGEVAAALSDMRDLHRAAHRAERAADAAFREEI